MNFPICLTMGRFFSWKLQFYDHKKNWIHGLFYLRITWNIVIDKYY